MFAGSSAVQGFTDARLSKYGKVSCYYTELRRILADGTGRQFNATEWLKKNAEKCSKTELRYIARNLHDWSDYPMYDAIQLANFYVAQKETR